MTVIAIDGTFSSGKGTLGKRLAAHYGLDYLDTGKLYRAAAHKVMRAGGDVENAAEGARAAKALSKNDLDDPILKSGPVGAAASKIAVHKAVRAALFDFQRAFAARGAVLDGRDIGTVICPDADVKIYIDAEPEERARRRHLELTGYGEDIDYETVLVKPAADAHLLDTTSLSIERAFAVAVGIVDAVLATNN